MTIKINEDDQPIDEILAKTNKLCDELDKLFNSGDYQPVEIIAGVLSVLINLSIENPNSKDLLSVAEKFQELMDIVSKLGLVTILSEKSFIKTKLEKKNAKNTTHEM